MPHPTVLTDLNLFTYKVYGIYTIFPHWTENKSDVDRVILYIEYYAPK